MREEQIGFINGLWFGFVHSILQLRSAQLAADNLQSPASGFFGLKIKERTVRLYNDRTTELSTTTLPPVSQAVARIPALPVSPLK